MKYSEILRVNEELAQKLKTETCYNVAFCSNITVNVIKEILEYSLRVEGFNASIKIGGYDNIIQDTMKYKDFNLIIIFWELSNIIDGLQYKIELYDEDRFNEILEKTKAEIDMIFRQLEKTSLVLFNKFTCLPFTMPNIKTTRYERLANLLNRYLDEKKQENIKIVNTDKVIADVGLGKSVDWRYYSSAKALYTVDFIRSYVDYIKPYIMSVLGKTKKILIFDCDNTLWKGVLGEDGYDQIQMSSATNEGAIFAEVQSIALGLNKQGILLGLCTKNNFDDVIEVLKDHPDMLLRDEHITIKKINWRDKVSNLKEIAIELSIGLDSMVVVDDSLFEVNHIRKELPDVTVLQVPERLYDYPAMMRNHIRLFYKSFLTKEDTEKNVQYKQQELRENAMNGFSNLEDYLSSLMLKIAVHENDASIVPRMSQMSQKTNQFNLTTKRYTEQDINNLIAENNSLVWAFAVSDKFGDNGITGMCIIRYDNDTPTAEICTFLMSCRIIGRNIEFAFMDYIVDYLSKKKIKTIKSNYIKTTKNELVEDFYDRCSFSPVKTIGSEKKYVLELSKYKSTHIKYIEVINERTN